MDSFQMLRRAGSVARTGDLLGWGTTRTQLRATFGAGHLLRVRKGIYALPDAPADHVAAVVVEIEVVARILFRGAGYRIETQVQIEGGHGRFRS